MTKKKETWLQAFLKYRVWPSEKLGIPLYLLKSKMQGKSPDFLDSQNHRIR